MLERLESGEELMASAILMSMADWFVHGGVEGR